MSYSKTTQDERMTFHSCWLEGSKAARDGKQAKDCPYNPLSYDFVGWMNGWANTKHNMAKEDDEL